MNNKRVDMWGNIHYTNENGEHHRLDGPAYEKPDGHKEWRINGKLHRDDGPAYEKPDSYKEWWINGLRHREDGPAVEWIDGNVEYWLNDIYYSRGDWEQEIFKFKLNRIKDL